MIDINIPNFITVGIISIAFYALLQFGLNKAGINIPFLTNN